MDRISGLYSIGWIGWIGLAGLDFIVLAGSGNTGFYGLAGYWLDGMDGLDGALVGRGWGGPTLAPAGTGAAPWATKQERHCWLLRGGRLWEAVAVPIALVLQGRGVFVSEKQNNKNIVHTNPNL